MCLFLFSVGLSGPNSLLEYINTHADQATLAQEATVEAARSVSSVNTKVMSPEASLAPSIQIPEAPSSSTESNSSSNLSPQLQLLASLKELLLNANDSKTQTVLKDIGNIFNNLEQQSKVKSTSPVRESVSNDTNLITKSYNKSNNINSSKEVQQINLQADGNNGSTSSHTNASSPSPRISPVWIEPSSKHWLDEYVASDAETPETRQSLLQNNIEERKTNESSESESESDSPDGPENQGDDNSHQVRPQILVENANVKINIPIENQIVQPIVADILVETASRETIDSSNKNQQDIKLATKHTKKCKNNNVQSTQRTSVISSTLVTTNYLATSSPSATSSSVTTSSSGGIPISSPTSSTSATLSSLTTSSLGDTSLSSATSGSLAPSSPSATLSSLTTSSLGGTSLSSATSGSLAKCSPSATLSSLTTSRSAATSISLATTSHAETSRPLATSSNVGMSSPLATSGSPEMKLKDSSAEDLNKITSPINQISKTPPMNDTTDSINGDSSKKSQPLSNFMEDTHRLIQQMRDEIQSDIATYTETSDDESSGDDDMDGHSSASSAMPNSSAHEHDSDEEDDITSEGEEETETEEGEEEEEDEEEEDNENETESENGHEDALTGAINNAIIKQDIHEINNNKVHDYTSDEYDKYEEAVDKHSEAENDYFTESENAPLSDNKLQVFDDLIENLHTQAGSLKDNSFVTSERSKTPLKDNIVPEENISHFSGSQNNNSLSYAIDTIPSSSTAPAEHVNNEKSNNFVFTLDRKRTPSPRNLIHKTENGPPINSIQEINNNKSSQLSLESSETKIVESITQELTVEHELLNNNVTIKNIETVVNISPTLEIRRSTPNAKALELYDLIDASKHQIEASTSPPKANVLSAQQPMQVNNEQALEEQTVAQLQESSNNGIAKLETIQNKESKVVNKNENTEAVALTQDSQNKNIEEPSNIEELPAIQPNIDEPLGTQSNSEDAHVQIESNLEGIAINANIIDEETHIENITNISKGESSAESVLQHSTSNIDIVNSNPAVEILNNTSEITNIHDTHNIPYIEDENVDILPREVNLNKTTSATSNSNATATTSFSSINYNTSSSVESNSTVTIKSVEDGDSQNDKNESKKKPNSIKKSFISQIPKLEKSANLKPVSKVPLKANSNKNNIAPQTEANLPFGNNVQSGIVKKLQQGLFNKVNVTIGKPAPKIPIPVTPKRILGSPAGSKKITNQELSSVNAKKDTDKPKKKPFFVETCLSDDYFTDEDVKPTRVNISQKPRLSIIKNEMEEDKEKERISTEHVLFVNKKCIDISAIHLKEDSPEVSLRDIFS